MRNDVGPEIMKHWRGVLPLNDIAELYSNAKIVLGTTMEKQEELGMVNNRVFEVLSCGARLVIPRFEALEELFVGGKEGLGVHYVDGDGDTSRIIEALLNDQSALVAGGNAAGRNFILREHSWDNRAATILDVFATNRFNKFYNSAEPGTINHGHRPRRPSIYLLHPSDSSPPAAWTSKLALMHESGIADFWEVRAELRIERLGERRVCELCKKF